MIQLLNVLYICTLCVGNNRVALCKGENERHCFGNEVRDAVPYLANSKTIVADNCSQIVHLGQSHLLKITENHLHFLPSPFYLCGCRPAVAHPHQPTPTLNAAR